MDMWVAAIDFKKAFDSTQHEAIFRSLRNHSTSEQYNCLPEENVKGLGIKLCDGKRDCVSNLRFADDVLMMATFGNSSKNDRFLQKKKNRKCRHSKSTQTRTQILTHQKTNTTREVEIVGMHEEILPPKGKVKHVDQLIITKTTK